MPNSPAQKPFDAANRWWALEGRTARALEAYREALRLAPDDPVILYQLARALWAVDPGAEARNLIGKAARLSSGLTDFGRKQVEEARRKITGAPPAWKFPADAASLDMDRLARRKMTAEQWSEIAAAAEEREMWGLAAQALERSSGTYADFDLARDQDEMVQRGQTGLSYLDAMRRNPPHTHNNPASEDSAEGRPVPAAAPAPDVVAPEARRIEGAPLPLEVSARVDPDWCALDERVSLTVAVTNASDRRAAVNRRLLLNHPSSPPGYGEIYLRVEGPPGYQNMTRFQVRAGEPDHTHFGFLSPGASISATWWLTDYESLHLPGLYRIRVCYRNTIHGFVEGQPLLLGVAESEPVTLTRYDPATSLIQPPRRGPLQ